MINVLFVCLGNICRSPTAHGVFEHVVREASLTEKIFIDSAGTGDWHIGCAPDKRAQAAAKQRGYPLDHLVARQVTPEDFQRFDYVLAMDKQNLSNLSVMKPHSYDGHLGLLLEFARHHELEEVPDPYYGGDQGFEDVLDMVEDASRGLLDHIRQRL
ncbi:low molecular weight phosphotyrosine protein phosphatase [Proteobacteria bacterium 005FR1]|nr:low molecular weight phosphotyrosine protein phosphatase [Proteobacteria bacterium 005FR1]